MNNEHRNLTFLPSKHLSIYHIEDVDSILLRKDALENEFETIIDGG